MTRAWEHGVERILIPGVDLASSRLALEISERDVRIFAAVGVHPTDAQTWDDKTLSALRDLARHPKTAAIGEIGLDYYWDRAPRDLQRMILQQQLELAQETAKPVSIHIRDAWEDIWDILSEWQMGLEKAGHPLSNRPGVLHSFSGNMEQAKLATERGFCLGISGPVTFPRARERQELVIALPQESLLIETDAPYLTPQPYRGRRNEPAHTHFIVQKIAELRQVTYNQIAAVTAENAARLFAWRA